MPTVTPQPTPMSVQVGHTDTDPSFVVLILHSITGQHYTFLNREGVEQLVKGLGAELERLPKPGPKIVKVGGIVSQRALSEASKALGKAPNVKRI